MLEIAQRQVLFEVFVEVCQVCADVRVVRIEILLRRETKIELSTTEQEGEVVLQMRCLELLAGEPIDAAEIIPFGRRLPASAPDLSLALVEQIARSASGRVLLGPGHSLRVILPASPAGQRVAAQREPSREV